MGIFLNYGGAGSHHEGAGRITLKRVIVKLSSFTTTLTPCLS